MPGESEGPRASDRARDAAITLRAFEIPDREPVAVSAPLEFEGHDHRALAGRRRHQRVAVVKREDTGWYEANRIIVTCAN